MESTLFLISAFALILTGLYGVLSRSNLIKILLALNILETGVNLIVVALGYVDGGTVPILTADSSAGTVFVDPLPHALVLTSIVIGLGTTALALTLTLRHFRRTGSLELTFRPAKKEAAE